MPPSFSAVLLAGGQSRRMGRDKALLPLPDFGQLLWQRQLAVLESLQPAEIFWSGRARPGLPGQVRVIPDVIENAGPLAGISACLDVSRSDRLLVLAVDLPRMTADFLARLLSRCESSRGVVVRHGEYFEPLAAIYPASLRQLAANHLEKGRFAMQDFIGVAITESFLDVLSLEEREISLFQNLNSVEDLARFSASNT